MNINETGSSFQGFLEAEGIEEKVNAIAEESISEIIYTACVHGKDQDIDFLPLTMKVEVKEIEPGKIEIINPKQLKEWQSSALGSLHLRRAR